MRTKRAPKSLIRAIAVAKVGFSPFPEYSRVFSGWRLIDQGNEGPSLGGDVDGTSEISGADVDSGIGVDADGDGEGSGTGTAVGEEIEVGEVGVIGGRGERGKGMVGVELQLTTSINKMTEQRGGIMALMRSGA